MMKVLLSIKLFFNDVFYWLGFDSSSTDSIHAFLDSTFHPETIVKTIGVSAILATVTSIFEDVFGFSVVVGTAIFCLFILELITGIKASKKEGNSFKSRKFNAGFVKAFIYFAMIGATNVLKNNVEVKEVLGYQLNFYEWIHYVLYNFAILQYIISNLENFERLGWNEYVPLLSKLKKVMNFDFSAIKNNKDE